MSYLQEAVQEYAQEHGRENRDCAWILSPFDTWERNPFYEGPAARHPEDERGDEDDGVYFPCVASEDEIPY
jgi:hypothetical protein